MVPNGYNLSLSCTIANFLGLRPRQCHASHKCCWSASLASDRLSLTVVGGAISQKMHLSLYQLTANNHRTRIGRKIQSSLADFRD